MCGEVYDESWSWNVYFTYELAKAAGAYQVRGVIWCNAEGAVALEAIVELKVSTLVVYSLSWRTQRHDY